MPEARKTYWHLAGARARPDRLRGRDVPDALLRRARLRGRGAALRLVSPLPAGVAAGLRRLGSLRRSARDDVREVRGAAAGQGDARRRRCCDRSRTATTTASWIRPGSTRWSGCCRRCATSITGCRCCRAYVGQMAPSGRDHDGRGAAGGGRDAPGSPHRLPDGDAPAAAARIRRRAASSCGRPIRRGSRCAS